MGSEPSEEFMRAIEIEVDIPETGACDYRRHLFACMGFRVLEGLGLDWQFEPRLVAAVETLISKERGNG